MAEKRMFTQKIIDSDAFLEMPLSAQALYFHLNMRADDDGFINNPKRIQRTIGSTEDDLKLLIVKRFVICFESGVIVIKHWRMHNTLRKDRYNPTQYQEELKLLTLKDNNSYTENESVATKWQPNGNQMATQYSIGKNSIDIDKNIYNVEKETTNHQNVYAEIIDYLNEKTNSKYRASNKTTQKHINARLKERYTVDDFKSVIDKKCAEWLGTNMEQYLRPETLFGTKFESYLNGKVSNKATPNKNEGWCYSQDDDLSDLF